MLHCNQDSSGFSPFHHATTATILPLAKNEEVVLGPVHGDGAAEIAVGNIIERTTRRNG
jgi:hypothetical protein